MSRIQVLVVAASSDVQAEGISAAVAHRPDMALIADRIVSPIEIAGFLADPDSPCALIIVGRREEIGDIASNWLTRRKNLVVLQVDIADDLVRIAARDAGMASLLSALRELVDRVGETSRERSSRITWLPETDDCVAPAAAAGQRPLLEAATNWVRSVLNVAVARLIDARSDGSGATMTTAAVADFLDAGAGTEAPRAPNSIIAAADAALSAALAKADGTNEPLGIAKQALDLSELEFRVLLLALAPELDVRHQRWIGLLMDDLTRRVGTSALYAGLLGQSAGVLRHLASSPRVMSWRVFEGQTEILPHADEPLRVDPPLRSWLLGERGAALADDSQLRRALRLAPWPGREILGRADVAAEGTALFARLVTTSDVGCLILGNDRRFWRALVEHGSAAANRQE